MNKETIKKKGRKVVETAGKIVKSKAFKAIAISAVSCYLTYQIDQWFFGDNFTTSVIYSEKLKQAGLQTTPKRNIFGWGPVYTFRWDEDGLSRIIESLNSAKEIISK